MAAPGEPGETEDGSRSRHPFPRALPSKPLRWAAGLGFATVATVSVLFGASVLPFGGPATGDLLTAEQIARRAATFGDHGPMIVESVRRGELSDAIATLELDRPRAEALGKALANQRARLAWLVLWDSHAHDGDVVEIRSAGFSIPVAVSKTQQRVAVPVGPTGQAEIVGVRDGGGGITLGALSQGQPVMLAVLGVGQRLPIRLVMGRP